MAAAAAAREPGGCAILRATGGLLRPLLELLRGLLQVPVLLLLGLLLPVLVNRRSSGALPGRGAAKLLLLLGLLGLCTSPLKLLPGGAGTARPEGKGTLLLLLACTPPESLPVLNLPLLLPLPLEDGLDVSGAPAQTVLHVSMMVLMLPPGTSLRLGGATLPPQVSIHRDSRSGEWVEGAHGRRCVNGALKGRGSGSISEREGRGELGMLLQPVEWALPEVQPNLPALCCCRAARKRSGADKLLWNVAWTFTSSSPFKGTEAGRASCGPCGLRGLVGSIGARWLDW